MRRAPKTLLRDRLSIPLAVSGELRRDRLLALLRLRDDRPLTLVSAPAGSGKTTLLSTWCSDLVREDRIAVAWVTCDPRECDPRTFWVYVTAALAVARGEEVPDPEAYQDVSTAVRLLEPAAGRPCVLVLDDVHAIGDPDTRSDLGYLIESVPAGAHLVLSTRVDPTLALCRARAADRVQEVRARDLFLTRHEVHELVRLHGVELSEQDNSRLWERTEGWTAGVKLSLLSMRHSADAASVVEGLAANPDPTVAGYLLEQSLSRLPAPTRDFLLRTSIVERLDPELAEVLTERTDSGQVLRSLVEEPGFVFRVDGAGTTFRYHALFRSLLVSELKLADRQLLRRLHRRVAQWAVTKGQPELAVEHALAGEDLDLAAGTLLDVAVEDLPDARPLRTTRLLELFPDTASYDPRLQVVRAWLDALYGDATQAVRRIASVRDGLGPGTTLRAVADLAEGWARLQLGEYDAVRQLCRTDRPPVVEDGWLDLQASAALWSGHVTGAADAPAVRAFVHVVHGELTDAEALTSTHDERPQVVRSLALAELHTERCRYDLAERALSELAELARPHVGRLAAEAARVRLRLLEGADPETTHDALDDLERRLDEGPGSWPSRRTVLLTRLEALLQQGRYAAALRLAAHEEALLPVVAVRVLVGMEAPGPGVDPQHLDDIVRTALGVPPYELVSPEGVRLVLGAAILGHQRGDDNRASALLHPVLAAVQTQGWRLPLCEFGEPGVALLELERSRFSPYGELATELLKQLRTTETYVSGGLVVPLSERETEVLQYLPTMLSQAELCASLFISRNTLKSHLRSIYRKLGVESRREAVERARELGLV